MIAHAIVQCEIGFPFLSPAAYWYIVTGDISQAVCYCNINDVRDIEVASLIQKVQLYFIFRTIKYCVKCFV